MSNVEALLGTQAVRVLVWGPSFGFVVAFCFTVPERLDLRKMKKMSLSIYELQEGQFHLLSNKELRLLDVFAAGAPFWIRSRACGRVQEFRPNRERLA